MNLDEVVKYLTVFLNSLDLPGMLPHVLTLKFNMPIILLRNINSPQLCNGTRLYTIKNPTDMLFEFKVCSFRCDSPLQ
ncbi:ATP-dependent DNA helicase PIF1-like [Aphis craccivora]|uniref:ATP-dependent DNA helicase PIF1-like n=1 Tax=Aphis craccivora TaxID=307492 RepID=A0A6G0Y7A5_APHCR|nr:ATP-dependent DNA helicase PIF1-like [Aphis craccivora]